MLKKIVLGTVFVIFIGALITGAVIRTIDKTDQGSSAGDASRGNQGISGGQGNGQSKDGSDGAGSSVAGTFQRNGQGKGGSSGSGSSVAGTFQGNGQDKGGSSVTGNSGAGTGQGRGGNSGEGSGLLSEPNTDHSWDTYSGVVTDVTADVLTIETDNGGIIQVDGRSWSYTQDLGFILYQGDLVEFEGFYEDGEFKVTSLENLSTGESITLRDADGRPAWSGGGKGN
jgi:hypothetical protein